MLLMRISAIVLGVLLGAMAATAQAETHFITSRISEIGAAGDYFKVYRLNPDNNDTEEIRIDVEPVTLFRGARSLANFEVGDVVSVSAEYNDFEEEWTARVVEPPDLPLE